jgi:predicted enzyme related to lactoylglutathione lyase
MLKYVKFSELPVDDQERALRFYTEAVGLTVAQDAATGDGGRWIELAVPGAQTRLLLRQRTGAEDPAGHMVFITEDVKGAYEQLSGRGVQFTNEPAPSPWNPSEWYAQFLDSEGNRIVISTY